MKRTKIIATLWPVTYGAEKITALYNQGVNIIRFNFSHADYDGTKKQLAIIRDLNQKWITKLGLLLDTKGPEIRTGDLDKKRTYIKGDRFNIFIDASLLDDTWLYCDYWLLIQDVELGGIIRIDSGLLDVKVIEKTDISVKVEALNDAIIWNRRHVNLPGVKLKLPGITKKDKQDILFAIEEKFDIIAASFVRNAQNIAEIKSLLKENDSDITIMAKIENQEGIENMEEIISTSDAVMVARGDLGIEVAIEKLPIYQKQIVWLARKYWKQVTIATHMLETMIDNPFPTRAESSDVFNSILERPDTLMLSWETAMGNFPIESVAMMTKIIKEAELHTLSDFSDYSMQDLTPRDIEKKALIESAVYAWNKLWVDALLVFTKTGKLAKITSLYRSHIPVYAFTGDENTLWKMSLFFWIFPELLLSWESGDYSKNLDIAVQQLLSKNVIHKESRIIVISDTQKNGIETPFMNIINVGDNYA